MIVIGLNSYPKAQNIAAITVQALFMINYFTFYSKKSFKEKWITMWIESQFLVYVVLKLWVIYDTDQNRIQNATGLVMAILLVSLQITSIILQVYSLVTGIYQFIKSRHQKPANRIATSSNTLLETERVKIATTKSQLLSLVSQVDGPQMSNSNNAGQQQEEEEKGS